jgi:hypothetical protein
MPPTRNRRSTGRILLACAIVLVGVLCFAFPAVASTVATIFVVIVAVALALLMIALVAGVLLYRRARAEILNSPAPELRSNARFSWPWQSQLDRANSKSNGRQKEEFSIPYGSLSDRFGAALRPEYLQAADDQDNLIAACGHAVYIYVRGPRKDEIRSVHRDLCGEIIQMADSAAPVLPTADLDVLRQLGDRSFKPRRQNWRYLADYLETSPAVFAVGRLLVLVNPRWREAATLYFKMFALLIVLDHD